VLTALDKPIGADDERHLQCDELWIDALGNDVKSATVYEPTGPAQIAPTLASMLAIRPPSGCACDPPLPHLLGH
jgi:hypothetical protein